MFSYSGMNAAQVERLQKEFGIYAVSSGRICVAALNNKNLDYVADAMARCSSRRSLTVREFATARSRSPIIAGSLPR